MQRGALWRRPCGSFQAFMWLPSTNAHPYTRCQKIPYSRPARMSHVARRRRYGVWEDSPGRKRTLRAVLLADRAHIIASLALHFAPGVGISHVFATAMAHAHVHPDIYEYVRVTPPALLVWLAQEFHLAGEAFSSPVTCFDTPFPRRSHFTHMPMFLGGVSVHRPRTPTKPGTRLRLRISSRTRPRFLTAFLFRSTFRRSSRPRLPVSSVSVTRPRLRDIRSSWSAGFETAPRIGAFAESFLSHVAPVGRQEDAMLLLTFPKGPFPAGAVMG